VQYRDLEGTDLTVSRAALGTMPFGSQTDEETSLRMIEQAIEGGVNFIDTANVYSAGRSEEIVGKAIRSRRDEIVLATKVRNPMGEDPELTGLSRKAIRRALDDSLRRLGVSHVDLYYLHQPDYEVAIEESLEAMDEAVRAGKVRYPASSNYAAWQVVEMFSIAGREGYLPARLTQPMYNLLARSLEAEYLPMAERMGVSTIVYNPLAGGLLTGKQSRETPLPGSRFDRSTHRLGDQYLDRYWYEAIFDAVEELRSLAERCGRSLIALALGWLLHHTPADCVILGASRPEQLAENLAALDAGKLPADALEACDAVWRSLHGVTPAYNR
jgi:aryl-alcohol dehydrogenase-like predicted oxidoreductase